MNAFHACLPTAALAAILLAPALSSADGDGSSPLSPETDHGAAVSSTERFSTTPANGVWDVEYGQTEDPADVSFSFQLFRHADGIRVKASVTDDKIVVDDCAAGAITCPSWDDDNLECFFDGDFDRSPDSRAGGVIRNGGEFTLVANGAAQSDYSSLPLSFGRKWTGSVKTTERPEGGYTLDYDLFFTWECLGRDAAPSASEPVTFGFNICVHDDDDGKRNDHALYWKGNPRIPCRDESEFGAITLAGSVEP